MAKNLLHAIFVFIAALAFVNGLFFVGMIYPIFTLSFLISAIFTAIIMWSRQ